MNHLKESKRNAVQILLDRGRSHREIAKLTGVHRNTIRSIAAGKDEPEDDNPTDAAPMHPVLTPSECEPHRAFIEEQIELGRNAMGIYQDLTDYHGFTSAYNSVKRFVAKLKEKDPERFDVLDHFGPGEECQVDYGLGAPTMHPVTGKYKRPYLFVMVSKYSGKAFRRVIWKTSQEAWAELHERAWRRFGGAFKYTVLDNLKEGVIKPDLYSPDYNPVHLAVLKHYRVLPDAAKVNTPDRKGTVENGVKHTQNTALKGKRFESIEEQNGYLEHWEERWAATRIHGRKKQQVRMLFEQEKPHLIALPVESFRYFTEEQRKVDDSGFIQYGSSWYSALPSRIGSFVRIRVYGTKELEILKEDGSVRRRHELSDKKGVFRYSPEDEIFNPTKKTADLLLRAERIGPHTAAYAAELFKEGGRASHRILYGLTNLSRSYDASDIEAVIKAGVRNFSAIKNALAAKSPATGGTSQQAALKTSGEEIRNITEYQDFFDNHAR